jgi:uncharacterized membrane protein YccF (DUF307 family)
MVMFITIIGIPFAVASVRLAEAALFPFGREIISIAVGSAHST